MRIMNKFCRSPEPDAGGGTTEPQQPKDGDKVSITMTVEEARKYFASQNPKTENDDELDKAKKIIGEDKTEQEKLKSEAEAFNKIASWDKQFNPDLSNLSDEQREMNKTLKEAIELVKENKGLSYLEQSKRIEKLVLKAHLEKDNLLSDSDKKLCKSWPVYMQLRAKALEMQKMQEKLKENGNFKGLGNNKNTKNPMLNRMLGGK